MKLNFRKNFILVNSRKLIPMRHSFRFSRSFLAHYSIKTGFLACTLFHKHTGKSCQGSICLAKSHFQPYIMLIHMLRLQLVDFHRLHKNFEFLSRNIIDSAQRMKSFFMQFGAAGENLRFKKLKQL